MTAILSRASLAFLCLSAVALAGPLPSDVKAMPGWTGTRSFSDVVVDAQGTWTLDADVEFAVYAPGDVELSTALAALPGGQAALNAVDTSGGADYVYAYQVFNMGPLSSGASNANVLNLSVDLFAYSIPFGAPAPGALAVASGIAPIGKQFIGSGYPKNNVKYSFSGTTLTPDKFSNILIFTSPLAPVWAPTSAMQGGHATTDQILLELPTPRAPEPSTAVLAAVGLGCLLLAGRVRRRFR